MEFLREAFLHLSEPAFLIKYNEYLLLIILVLSFLEVLIPPIPGDTVLILGSSIAGVAKIHPLGMVAAAFCGTFSASVLLYNLGYKLEHKWLESPRFSGLLDSKAFVKIETWFRRFGYWTLLLSRFLPVARSGIVLVAGIVNYDKRTTLIALALSIFASSSVFVWLGGFLGRRWKEIFEIWNPRLQTSLWILLGLLIVVGIWFWVTKWKKSKQ